MDIKGYLSRLFKAKELGMISLNDMAYIPTRDELNSELVKLLDQYKENYKEVLLQDKYITSYDISSKDYSDDMIMNFYLFNRLIINQDEVYNLDTMEEYKRNELFLKYKINPYKILLYMDKMEEIYNETLLRLIALKEIVNELELDKNKIDAIKNEIDTLTTHYIIFKNNLYASLMEINNLKNNINRQFDRYNEYSSNLLVKAYYNRLKKYYKDLMLDKFEEIDKLDLPLINKLANLERELEVYCYHSIDINKLNEELQEIDKIEKTSDNRKYLLQRINELALRYEVLNRYGGYELDLTPLYEVKFDILTIDIIHQEDSPFSSIDNKRELKYYEDIIFNIITKYVIGKDSILNNQLDVNDKDIIQCFVDILRMHTDIKYDLYDILMDDKFKLCLLLNIPNGDKIIKLFDNTMINSYKYVSQMILNSYGIELCDLVPLSTLCRLQLMKKNEFINTSNYDIFVSYARIYEYYANKQKKNTDEYKVPEGIKKIDFSLLGNIDLLINKINDKTIIMPSTLETFVHSEAFKDINVSIPKIVFNEGFKYTYDYYPFTFNNLESITIPSSLEMLYFYVHSYFSKEHNSFDTAKEFIFTNFEDSIFLNSSNKSGRDSLLDSIFSMLYYDFLKVKEYKLDTVRNMHIILSDKSGNQYLIDLRSIFLDLLYEIKQENIDYEEISANVAFKLEINQRIDKILAQYKEQKENRHKL